MTKEEFESVAAEYCRNPQVRFDLLQFQDQNPGISGSYDAESGKWHIWFQDQNPGISSSYDAESGKWYIWFNGAHGVGDTHEDAYADMEGDDDRRWQEYLEAQAEWANA